MTLLSWYQAEVAKNALVWDEAQCMAIQTLDSVLLQFPLTTKPTKRWWRRVRASDNKGVYLYGGVGRGKTFLVDRFFELVPAEKKSRWHFHTFMQRIHQGLQSAQGREDPLKYLASDWAKKNDLLVFDEFFVSDITDAMLLGRLFHFLFEQGVVMVFTSNIPPSYLYRNGLQRERFLPAIAAIKTHCEVVNLSGDWDHRQSLETQLNYFLPTQKADFHARCVRVFPQGREERTLLVHGREITILGQQKRCFWASFESLCASPRHNVDYIWLADRFQTWFLEGVPQWDGSDDTSARRFLSLVDECYDKRVQLVILAQVPWQQLYLGKGLAFEFERCLSRLVAMQDPEYCQR